MDTSQEIGLSLQFPVLHTYICFIPCFIIKVGSSNIALIKVASQCQKLSDNTLPNTYYLSGKQKQNKIQRICRHMIFDIKLV